MPATRPGYPSSTDGRRSAASLVPHRSSALGVVFGLLKRLPQMPLAAPARRATARAFAFDLHGLPTSPRQTAAPALKAPGQGQQDDEDEAFLRSLREAGM